LLIAAVIYSTQRWFSCEPQTDSDLDARSSQQSKCGRNWAELCGGAAAFQPWMPTK